MTPEMIFITLFIGFGIIYFLIGLYASREIKTTIDYFLAGKTLGISHVTFTLVATQIGGGLLLGTSEKAYQIGIYGMFYTLGMSIGFLILGCGLAGKLHAFNIHTVSELFEIKYRSVFLKWVSSGISIATMTGILISQVVALKVLLNGLGLYNEWVFVAFWTFIIAYTMVGGLKAVVFTDVVQVMFIVGVFGLIFFNHIFYGPFPLKQILASQKEFAEFSISLWDALPMLIIPALYALIEQDLAQRFFASRSRKTATISAIFSSIILIFFAFVPLYFGMEAHVMGLSVPEGTSPLIVLLKNTTGIVLFSLALCGLIAAITSTADSLLCAISLDIAKGFKVVSIHRKSGVFISQMITLLTGIVAFIASYFVPKNIIDILIASYEISVSCMLVPLLATFFTDNLKKNSAWFSFIGGLIGFIFTHLYMTDDILRQAIAIGCSLIGFILGIYI